MSRLLKLVVAVARDALLPNEVGPYGKLRSACVPFRTWWSTPFTVNYKAIEATC
jgi:hypothetical protein